MFKRKRLFDGSQLSLLRQRVLSTELCCQSMDADADYTSASALLVWVAHMLHTQTFLDESQWRLVLAASKDYIASIADPIIRQLRYSEPYPADWVWPQLVFCDGRYVTWPTLSSKGYLDLETGDYVDTTVAPVITVAYHLDALAARELRRCLNREHPHVTEPRPSA